MPVGPGGLIAAPKRRARESRQGRGHFVPLFVRRPDTIPALHQKQFDTFARYQEPAYDATALRLFREMQSELHALALEILRPAKAANKPRPRGTTAASLDEFRERLGASYDDYHRRWRERFHNVVQNHVAVVGGSVSAELGLGFDVYNERNQSFIRERVNLLAGNVNDTTFRGILASLEEGWEAGEGTNELANRVHRLFGVGYSRVLRDGTRAQVLSARQRARLIARTETTANTNGASLAVINDSGIEYWKSWITQGDERVRPEHAAISGEKVDSKAEFSNGKQFPDDPNCLLPGTLVRGEYLGAVRAHYTGEVVEITTAGGRQLTVTPNHPILTPVGFAAAYLLRTGDDLVCYSSDVDRLTDQYQQDVPVCVEQVYHALAEKFPRTRRKAAVHNFHGDAVGMRGDVEIVSPDGILLLDGTYHPTQLAKDHIFVQAAMSAAAESGEGADSFGVEGVGHPQPGIPGGPALANDGGASFGFELLPFQAFGCGTPSVFRTSRFHAQLDAVPCLPGSIADGLHRLAADVGRDDGVYVNVFAESGDSSGGAERNTMFPQNAVQYGCSDSELATNLRRRLPAFITLDRIVRIERSDFSGHVYDLESVSGWNIANDIVTSNCRCTLLYDVKGVGEVGMIRPGERAPAAPGSSRPSPRPGQFTTGREGWDWAQARFPGVVWMADPDVIDSLDVEVLNSTLSRLDSLAEEFPEVMGEVRDVAFDDWIGPAGTGYAAATAYVSKPRMSLALSAGYYTNGSAFRSMLEQDVVSTRGVPAWHVASSAQFDSVLTHEFGHLLHGRLYRLANDMAREVDGWIARWLPRAGEVSGLAGSESAGRELFAEAFAALRHGTSGMRNHPAVVELARILSPKRKVEGDG